MLVESLGAAKVVMNDDELANLQDVLDDEMLEDEDAIDENDADETMEGSDIEEDQEVLLSTFVVCIILSGLFQK